MLTLVSITEYLFWTTVVGYAVLYVRLRQQQLHHVYRVFTVFILFRFGHAIVLSALPPIWYALRHVPRPPFNSNDVYAYTWTLTQPLLWLLHILVVLELYSLVLQGYKGIASMGRWAVIGGLTVATVLSFVSFSTEMAHSTLQYSILRWMVITARGVDSSLVLFLLLITTFLVWFPVPLNRNVVVYSTVYAFYFTTGALAELAFNLSNPAVRDAVNAALVVTNVLSVWTWIALLNRAGEAKKVVVRHAWAPQQEEVLLQQLAAINKTLMRSGRTK